MRYHFLHKLLPTANLLLHKITHKIFFLMLFNERNLVVLCTSWKLCHSTRQQRDCLYWYTSFIVKEEAGFKELMTFFSAFFFFFLLLLLLPHLRLGKLLLLREYIVYIYLACTKMPRIEVPLVIYSTKTKIGRRSSNLRTDSYNH